MAESKKKEELEVKITPISTGNLKTAEAGVARFAAVLPPGITKDDIENPKLYSNIASRVPAESEIRVNAHNESFVAWMYVSFSHMNDMRVHTIKLIELEEIKEVEGNQRYIAKLRGRDKWCIIDNNTGESVKKNIPTQLACLQEIADYSKALNK